MARRRIARTIFILLACICGFIAWYAIATDYDYSAVAGTYVSHDGNDICTLRLNADGTFFQQITTEGEVRTATGTWHRFGESGMALSASFMRVSHQEPGPSGENYGSFYKTLGVLPWLQLNPDPGGPVFRRKLTRW